MSDSDAHQLAALVKQKARDVGFDLAGVCSPEPSRYRDYFRQWLDDGQAGTMHYLAARFHERMDPAVYFPAVQSVICLAVNYHTTLEDHCTAEPAGRIARYALGDDYHETIKSRLHQLADWLRQILPDSQSRCSVDTAPLMEKELAARAGLGWVGKNNCLIHPRVGSWLLLGEVLTSVRLPFDDPAMDRCGNCMRCIEACPTGAITAPYQLDARKCISYLTIEHRADDIESPLRQQIGDWIFGCDICQDVCPFNRKAPITDDTDFQPRFETGKLGVREVLGWSPPDYSIALRGSAMKRVKLPVLQRNARMVAENLHHGA